MTFANDESRTVEESYSVAVSASNLKVDADRNGSADLLIAAGWSPGMLGSAALRLRGEWDSSEKPRPGQDMKQELALLSQKLKSFRAVREALSVYMGKQDAQRVIFWWLDQNCQKCAGTKFEVVKGTNRHGARFCKACQGSGVAHIPLGQEGRKAANFLDFSVGVARASISRRLKATRTEP